VIDVNITIDKKLYSSNSVDSVSCVSGGFCGALGFYVVKGVIGGASAHLRCAPFVAYLSSRRTTPVDSI
jgi:hypothetical protein